MPLDIKEEILLSLKELHHISVKAVLHSNLVITSPPFPLDRLCLQVIKKHQPNIKQTY